MLKGFNIGDRRPYRGFLVQSIRLPSGGHHGRHGWVKGTKKSHAKLWDRVDGELVARRFETVKAAKEWAKGKRGAAC